MAKNSMHSQRFPIENNLHPRICAPINKKFVKSHSQLVGVNMLQKKSILVYNLPKSKFDSVKKVQVYFGKYGKVCQCVVEPDLMENIELKNSSRYCNRSKTTIYVYIAYLNEKCATIAKRNLDGREIDGIKIKVDFPKTTYCDMFLQGKYCDNLQCILLHEWVKEVHVDKKDSQTCETILNANPLQHSIVTPSPKRSPKSRCRRNISWKSLEKSSKHSCDDMKCGFQGNLTKISPPTKFDNILCRSPVKKRLSSERTSLEIHTLLQKTNQESIATPQNHHHHGEEYSLTIDHQSKRKGSYAEVSKIKQTPFQNCESNNKSIGTLDILGTNRMGEKTKSLFDTSNRQILKNTKKPKCCIVSPPKKVEEELCLGKTTEGIDSPWGFQSPITIIPRNLFTSPCAEKDSPVKNEKGDETNRFPVRRFDKKVRHEILNIKSPSQIIAKRLDFEEYEKRYGAIPNTHILDPNSSKVIHPFINGPHFNSNVPGAWATVTQSQTLHSSQIPYINNFGQIKSNEQYVNHTNNYSENSMRTQYNSHPRSFIFDNRSFCSVPQQKYYQNPFSNQYNRGKISLYHDSQGHYIQSFRQASRGNHGYRFNGEQMQFSSLCQGGSYV